MELLDSTKDWWAMHGQPVMEAILAMDTDRLQKIGHEYSMYLKDMYEESPGHVVFEAFLTLFIIYIIFFKQSYNPREKGFGAHPPERLTEADKKKLLKEWQPEPLVTKAQIEEARSAPKHVVLNGRQDTYVQLSGQKKKVLNLATYDFLGIGRREEVFAKAKEGLNKYGVGSCGPRGFYGTVDAHLELEERIANFMQVPESIVYSDGFSTTASALPAFAKRGDLLVLDRGICAPLQMGAILSKAKILSFQHNDMTDLERVLQGVRQVDRKLGRGSDCQRRFIVVEGLYRCYGDIVKLPQVLQLAKKYFFRVFIDESFSLGVLGESGRGVTEHFGHRALDVDIITASLETAVASVGGFCVGPSEVVDHQRLAGGGYVYSASSAPFFAISASAGMSILADGVDLRKTLQDNARFFDERLSNSTTIRVISDPRSPLKLITLPSSTVDDLLKENAHTTQDSPATVDSRNGDGHSKYQGQSGEGSESEGESDIDDSQTEAADVDENEDEGDPYRRRVYHRLRQLLFEVRDMALEKGVAISCNPCLKTDVFASVPALSLAVTVSHTRDDLNKAASVVEECVQSTIEKYQAASMNKGLKRGSRSGSRPYTRKQSANAGTEEAEGGWETRKSTRQRKHN